MPNGYVVGSLWIDTTHDKAYVCLDSTVGAAVWTEITVTTGGSGTGPIGIPGFDGVDGLDALPIPGPPGPAGAGGLADHLHTATGDGGPTLRPALLSAASPTTLTIASDQITVTQTWHKIDTEGGAASDNLAQILGGVAGDVLVLQITATARKVTAQHGTGAGNMVLAGGVDKLLASIYDRLVLRLSAEGRWVEESSKLLAVALQSHAAAHQPGGADPIGAINIPGLDGIDGMDGVDGVGTPGAAGATGAAGAAGPAGTPGQAGMDGLDGADGLDGFSIVGPTGATGAAGSAGAAGAPGVGLPGLDGQDGVDGFPTPTPAHGASLHTGTIGYYEAVISLFLDGAQTTGTTKKSWSKYVPWTNGGTIIKAILKATTGPTGADFIVDIHNSGIPGTIWATQDNRVKIAAGATAGISTTFDTPALALGNIITVDVDQIGSTVAGSDIDVQLVVKVPVTAT